MGRTGRREFFGGWLGARLDARGEEETGTSPAKFRRGVVSGVEKERPASTRSSRRTFWRSWEGEGTTGGGVPTVDRSGGGGSELRRGGSGGDPAAKNGLGVSVR
jgi:hypothetical protein